MLWDAGNFVVEEALGDAGGGSFVVVAFLDAETLGINNLSDDDDGKMVVFDVVVVVVVVVEVVLEVAVLVISNSFAVDVVVLLVAVTADSNCTASLSSFDVFSRMSGRAEKSPAQSCSVFWGRWT